MIFSTCLHCCHVAEPSEVTNVEVKAESTKALLTWKPPSNVPVEVEDKVYSICDRVNSILESSHTERVTLKDLVPYHHYNMTISLNVGYKNETFDGAESSHAFMTDVDKPGPVTHLDVLQEFNLFRVYWDPPLPNETNGPIDFYYVKVFDEDQTLIQELYAFRFGFCVNVVMRIL